MRSFGFIMNKGNQMERGAIKSESAHAGKSMIPAILIVCFLAFYLWMAAQIPYTLDDWEWGTSEGIRHLLTADMNSRYVGNVIEIVLTRSAFLKTLAMGLTFTAIPLVLTALAYRFASLSGEHDASGWIAAYLFSNVLFLCTPSSVWAETCGWVAGFSNYVVSALCLLLFLLIIFNLLKNSREKHSESTEVFASIGCFLFGIVIQLMLENLTVCFWIISLAVTIRAFHQRHPARRKLLILFLGCSAGLAIMFSSGIYATLWNTGYAIDGYRELAYDRSRPFYIFLVESIWRFFGVFIPKIISDNAVYPTLMSVVLFFAWLKNGKQRNMRKGLIYSAEVLHLFFTVYYLVCCVFGHPISSHYVYAGIDLLYTALITSDLFLLYRGTGYSFGILLIIWVLPFFIISPLLAVEFLSPRCYLAPNMCMSLLIIILAASLWRDSRQRRYAGQIAIATCAIAALLCTIHWGRVYYAIGNMKRERDVILQEARDEVKDTIVMPAFPYGAYLYVPDPSPSWLPYFLEFYDVPDHVSIVFESRQTEGESS